MKVAHWNIAKQGDPLYATKKYENELSNGLKSDDIPIERIFRPDGRLRGSTACSWLLNYRTLDADIVHATFQTVAPAAFVHGPKRFVVTVHDVAPLVYDSLGTDLSARLQWALTPTALERADRLIAISSFTKDELVSRTEVDPDDVRVVPQGVDHDLYRPMNQADARRRLNLDPDATYLLVVASNAPHKRLDLTKRVFRAVRERREDIKLLKAGYGMGLDGEGITSVDWLPESEMPLLYNSADAYLHTSEYEGFGLPVLEAMACGVPVVVNDRASLPEVAGEERVVDIRRDTVDSVAEHILELLGERPDEAALERSERFSWRRTTRETRDVYHELLDK
jgi:alpha-1,3-rhamnosyl/mannosyltransferase